MKKSIINVISGAIGFLVPMSLNIIFTPLIIKHLGNEAYGLQSLVNVVIGFLMVGDMGLDIPVTKYVAEFNSTFDYKKLNNLLNTSFKVYLVLGIFGCCLIFFLTPYLVDHVFIVPFNLRNQAINVFYLAALGFIGGLFSIWGKSIFNGILRYDISNGISIITNFLSLITGFLFVLHGYGVVWFVFSKVIYMFISGAIFILLGKYYLPNFYFTRNFDKSIWDILKKQIGYGFLLRISGIITSRLDQTLIGIWLGLSFAGYYSIAILVTSSITGLIGSMTHFIFPSISGYYINNNHNKVQEIFINGTRLVAIIVFVTIVPLIFLQESFLQLWLGKDVFLNVNSVFRLLLIATGLQTLIVLVLNAFIVGIGNLKTFTYYSLIRGLIVGLFCIVLIKPIGIEGAGWALISACIFDVIFFFYIKNNFIKFSIPKEYFVFYLKLLIISCVLYFTFKLFVLKFLTTWLTLCIASILYLLFFLLLSLVFRLWGENEKKIYFKIKEKIFLNFKSIS